MKHSEVDASARERLAALLLSGESGVEDMAEALSVSLSALGALGDDATLVGMLRGLDHLARMRTELLMSRCRAHAALRLMELTGEDTPPETARKACVDLLRETLGVFAAEGDAAAEGSGAVDEAALLRSWAALGDGDGDGDGVRAGAREGEGEGAGAGDQGN